MAASPGVYSDDRFARAPWRTAVPTDLGQTTQEQSRNARETPVDLSWSSWNFRDRWCCAS